MEKLPKILRIVLFALWAVAGLLLAIDTGISIPDAQQIGTNSLIFTIVETCLFITITIIGLVATIKAIKTQEELEKLDKRNNPIVLLVGITLAVVAYSQFMIMKEALGSYGREFSMPSEILTIIIFSILVILATIIVKVIKIKGEHLPNFIKNSVVGALALITIFIFLSYFKPEGLTMFGMILLLIAIIAYIGLPYIYKYVLKEGVSATGESGCVSSVAHEKTTTSEAGTTQTSRPATRHAVSGYICAPAADIREAHALLKDGLITEEEYSKIKSRIIERF